MDNQLTIQLARNLKRASTKNDAPIWKKVAEFALKPSSVRRVVNVNKINKLTKADDVIIVPGKVLGTGIISHKITLCSFSISNSAVDKILEVGGKIISFTEMIQKYPTGKGVIIIG
jgi:large subunit ribosomal protein L18e